LLSETELEISSVRNEQQFLSNFSIPKEYVPLIPIMVGKWNTHVSAVKAALGNVSLPDFPVANKMILHSDCVNPEVLISEEQFFTADELNGYLVLLYVSDSTMTHWNLAPPRQCYMARANSEGAAGEYSRLQYGAADCSDLLLEANASPRSQTMSCNATRLHICVTYLRYKAHTAIFFHNARALWKCDVKLSYASVIALQVLPLICVA
jgi:hypothetical protein